MQTRQTDRQRKEREREGGQVGVREGDLRQLPTSLVERLGYDLRGLGIGEGHGVLCEGLADGVGVRELWRYSGSLAEDRTRSVLPAY